MDKPLGPKEEKISTPPTVGALSMDDIQKLIKRGKDRRERQKSQWNKWLAWMRGSQEASEPEIIRSDRMAVGDQSDNLTELMIHNNYAFAYLDTMAANTVPSNPQVSIQAIYEEKATAGRNRERVVNHYLRENEIHTELKKGAIWAGIAGFGIFKQYWDTEDARPATYVVSPLDFYFDERVKFSRSRYYIEAIHVPKADMEARFDAGWYKKDLRKQVASLQGKDPHNRDDGTSETLKSEYYTVYEVYDRPAKLVYHVMEGIKTPLLKGSLATKAPMYTLLHFNEDLELFSGMSDIQLISTLLDRLNEIDSLELQHAHATIPRTVMDRSKVKDAEEVAEAWSRASNPGDLITIDMIQPQMTAEQVFRSMPVAGLQPTFDIMRERIVAMIEMVLGLPAYMRGASGKSEVATELALVDTQTKTRAAKRDQANRKVVETIAQQYIELVILYGNAPVKTRSSKMDNAVAVAPAEMRLTDDPNDYVYDMIAFSPTENHKLVQLQKLQQFMEFLVQSPVVNADRLVTKLVSLLGLEEVLKTPEEVKSEAQAAAEAQQAQQAQLMSAQVPPEPPSDGDTISSGAVPGGLDEALLPPSARVMADQPKV